MTAPLWTLDDVTLAGRAAARLDGVTLSIGPGVTAVVGPSGAGKTSLLNLLVGYEQPDSGRMERSVPTDARLPVFWVPQDDGLWPGVTARGHLELVAPKAREIASELLDAFDLTGVADATPDRLSRGEASRLAVARAIASDASALVLDEPLAHVDPGRRWRYWDRLARHAEETGTSLVFASHEPEAVLRYADRVIAVRDGRVVFDGPTRSLYADPPTEDHAVLLGPANWFEAAERSRWRVGRDAACVRPERLSVEPAADGPATVVASRSAGAVDESDLMTGSGEPRRFVHRPSARPLAAGTRVRLAVLGLLAAVVLPSCESKTDGPRLEVSGERSFALPSEGPTLPGPRAVAEGRAGERITLDNAGRVLIYAADGTLRRRWTMPEFSVGKPEGVCLLPDGRLAVADTHYHRVVFFTQEGEVAGMFGELGKEPGQFVYPVAVTTDPAGNLYVAEYGGNDRIQKFAPDGRFLVAFGSFGDGEGQFQRPSGVAWKEGLVYVADAFNSRLHVFTDAGESRGLLNTGAAGLHYPYDLSLGPDGLLYVIEYGSGRLSAFETDGRLVGRHGSTGVGAGHFRTPWGLSAGSDGRVWVADTGNRRIVELTPAGAVSPGGRP